MNSGRVRRILAIFDILIVCDIDVESPFPSARTRNRGGDTDPPQHRESTTAGHARLPTCETRRAKADSVIPRKSVRGNVSEERYEAAAPIEGLLHTPQWKQTPQLALPRARSGHPLFLKHLAPRATLCSTWSGISPRSGHFDRYAGNSPSAPTEFPIAPTRIPRDGIPTVSGIKSC